MSYVPIGEVNTSTDCACGKPGDYAFMGWDDDDKVVNYFCAGCKEAREQKARQDQLDHWRFRFIPSTLASLLRTIEQVREEYPDYEIPYSDEVLRLLKG